MFIKKISAIFATILFSLCGPAQADVYFVHNDHLGTPQTISDKDQQIVWQADYEPFGAAQVTVENLENNIRFPGQYYDQETGLHYNYFRDYDPSTGRYIESDPIGLDGGLNTYLYANANPVRFTDPTGENPASGAIWGGNIGTGIGAAGGPIGAAAGRVIGSAIGAGIGYGIAKMCEDDKDDDCDLQFVRETPSYDGKTKTCWYKRKGVMFTFPQAVGFPCPPIDREKCMVDTSYIRPPARY